MRKRLVAVATALPLLLGACGSGSTVDNAQRRQAVSSATAKIAKDVTEKDFDRGNFPPRPRSTTRDTRSSQGRSTSWKDVPTGAKVSKTGIESCVPVKCYDNVLLIDEWNPLEPGDAHQLKYYALGVGNVRVGAVADPEAEELVLVKVSRLNPPTLAEARAEALKLEKHADTVSRNLYGQTLPAN